MNLTQIKEYIAQYILSKKSDIKIYSEYKFQGVKYPCFFINLISSIPLCVANVNYGKNYELDLIYLEDYAKVMNHDFNEIEEILYEIPSNDKLYIEHSESEIVDKVLHHRISVTVLSGETSVIETENTTYKAIITKLKSISNNVFYQSGDLSKLNDGFFVVEPMTVQTENSALNGRKDYIRRIKIRYVINYETSKNKDVANYLELTIDELIKSLIKSGKILMANYELNIQNYSEEYKEISVISYEAILEITERK